MKQFYAKYKCGKSKKIMDLGEEGTLISGIRVKQKPDFSFTWDMTEYAKTLEKIELPRGYYAQVEKEKKTISEQMLGKVKALNGKIGWLGGNGRPDIAAGHSIIAGNYKHQAPSLIRDCNQCVQQAHQYRIYTKVWSIAPKELRVVAFCDSSFDHSGERHQQGWLLGYTNRYLNDNERAPVSIA